MFGSYRRDEDRLVVRGEGENLPESLECMDQEFQQSHLNPSFDFMRSNLNGIQSRIEESANIFEVANIWFQDLDE